MKLKNGLHVFSGWLIAFLISFGGIGCLMDGFHFQMPGLLWLALVCGLIAAIFCLFHSFRYGNWAALLAAAVFLFCFWKEFWEQGKTLLWMISEQLHRDYGWPMIPIVPENDQEPVFNWILVLIAVGPCGEVSRTVCRRKRCGISVFLGALPLTISLISTNTMPENVVYLYTLLLGMVLLIVTNTVRRLSQWEGVLLTGYVLIPTAILLAILFLLFPIQSYVNHADDLRLKVWGRVEDTLSIGEKGGNSGDAGADVSGKSVNLSMIGPKRERNGVVMRVNSPISQQQYLRGQDYDIYDGMQWLDSGDRTESFGVSPWADIVSAGELEIVTLEPHSVYYIPYYSVNAQEITDGRLLNPEKQRSYSFELVDPHQTLVITMSIEDSSVDSSQISTDPELIYETAVAGMSETFRHYCQLPEETAEWARAVLRQIPIQNMDMKQRVDAVTAYVRASAIYSLTTPRMPEDNRDFARWFLEESDTGYCVHFASLTTVLLRAMGIPARYVEGYTVMTKAGQWTPVTQKMAHAWSEYYDPLTQQWYVAEATPADLTAFSEQELPTELTLPETVGPEQSGTQPNQAEQSEVAEKPVTEAERKMREALTIFIRITLIFVVVYLQRRFRLAYRRRKMESASANQKALMLWRDTERVCRTLRENAPENLYMLAGKAAFSQHTLQEEELKQFAVFLREATEELQKRGFLLRLWFRYVLALY